VHRSESGAPARFAVPGTLAAGEREGDGQTPCPKRLQGNFSLKWRDRFPERTSLGSRRTSGE
jgi:hypothetical protein